MTTTRDQALDHLARDVAAAQLPLELRGADVSPERLDAFLADIDELKELRVDLARMERRYDGLRCGEDTVGVVAAMQAQMSLMGRRIAAIEERWGIPDGEEAT